MLREIDRSKYFSAVLAGACVLLGCSAFEVQAARLSQEACYQLRTQSAAMIAAGVKKDLAKDIAWARVNLPAARIKQVITFIDLTEKILFRCPPPPPPVPERAGREGVAQAKPVPIPVKSRKTGLGVPPIPARRPNVRGDAGSVLGPYALGAAMNADWGAHFKFSFED